MKNHSDDTLSLFNALSDLEKEDAPLEHWLQIAMNGNRTSRKLLEQPVKEWYQGAFPAWFDHLLYLDPEIDFRNVVHCIDQGKDLYRFLSDDDEPVDWDCIDHVLSRPEELLGIDYSVIYDRWVCRDKRIQGDVMLGSAV